MRVGPTLLHPGDAVCICSSSSPALYFYRGFNDIMVKNCYPLSYLPLSSFKGPISSPSCNAFYLVQIWEGG